MKTLIANDSNNEKDYYVYLIRFSNDRIKVGITSDLDKRFSYYKQEARRHDLRIDQNESYLILAGKKAALEIESIICKEYKKISINKHREWFKGDYLMFIFVTCRIQQISSYESALFFDFYGKTFDEWITDPFFSKDFSVNHYKNLASA